jgi:hypothetical protein
MKNDPYDHVVNEKCYGNKVVLKRGVKNFPVTPCLGQRVMENFVATKW